MNSGLFFKSKTIQGVKCQSHIIHNKPPENTAHIASQQMMQKELTLDYREKKLN